MAGTKTAGQQIKIKYEIDEDEEIKNTVISLVNKIIGTDFKAVHPAIEMIKTLIRTATTSLTSVPKPLKYLLPYYNMLKNIYKKFPKGHERRSLADIISVLAIMDPKDGEGKKNKDCLKYCLEGTMELQNTVDPGWGHEYIRHLESDIIHQWNDNCRSNEKFKQLIEFIVQFNFTHNAEIQACDLLMEIDSFWYMNEYINETNYQRVCNYLLGCAKYTTSHNNWEDLLILVYCYYGNRGDYLMALIVALQLSVDDYINSVFITCKDKATLYQMAFVCARHLKLIKSDVVLEKLEDNSTISNILNNGLLNEYFLTLAKELDIMEPKLPEEIFKTWLEPVPSRLQILADHSRSVKYNLACFFVNGFVNAAFGLDKLMSTENGNKQLYKHKHYGMLSAVASLGLIHLWDVDGGLTQIDKYFYANENYIKAGALLATGMVNCRVRNECDPALGLLNGYINSETEVLQVGAILGLGLAYAGTNREDVLNLILPIVSTTKNLEVLAISSLSCGLVSLGQCNDTISKTILSSVSKMYQHNPSYLKSPFLRLVGLGAAFCYFGSRDNYGTTWDIMESFPEPYRATLQTMLVMCSLAATGNMTVVEQLFNVIGEQPLNSDNIKIVIANVKTSETIEKTIKLDPCMNQAMAMLAVATIVCGENIATEMAQRIFGHVGKYGEQTVKKAVPLGMALLSISNPQCLIIDILTKYAHDSNNEIACNSILGLGLVGSGTNNSRISAILRQLAVYHIKNTLPLFMIRIAQGLVCIGKGTMTLNPLHTDRLLFDKVGMAGILIVLVSLLDSHTLVLDKMHYLIYCLSLSMNPRWLLTLNEDLQVFPTTVRIGQAVDTIGKAGMPKTIAGIRTHSTPVLLATGERAEIISDELKQFVPTLDGICILTAKTAA